MYLLFTHFVFLPLMRLIKNMKYLKQTRKKVKLFFFQHTNRYICSAKGETFCQTGWKEPEDPNLKDELNPCPQPICDRHGETCSNGECRAPNYCACDIGWEGELCDICVCLPGCVHGNCTEALECNCFDGWEGGFCDVRKFLGYASHLMGQLQKL